MIRPYIITILSITFAVLFSFIAASCDRSDDVSLKKTKGDTQEIDRLFREADVLRIQSSTGPIEIILKDMNGIEKELSDFRGNIIFLNF